MAGFKTHLAGGIAVGAGVSAAAYLTNSFSLAQSGAIFMAGAAGGLLPDLDSDTGKALAFLFSFVSVLIPSLAFARVAPAIGHSPETIICYFTLSYLFINYVACSVVKIMTVHRGIMHSMPFALLSGLIAYWLFMNSDRQMALYASVAMFAGCLAHLVLDELHSFSFKLGIIPYLKKSSGTALKFWSNSVVATVFCYFLIGVVAFGIGQNTPS